MIKVSCRKKILTVKLNKINQIWVKDNKLAKIFKNKRNMNLNKKSKKHLLMKLKI